MAKPREQETVTQPGSLTPERFARVRAIFEAAVERPAAERRAYAAGACAGDAGLLREVEAMLAAEARPDALLDSRPSSSAPEEGRFPAGMVLAGRYRILGPLGHGGMGEVYKAFDLILNQTVALKFLSPVHISEAALVRFRNEVRVARQVSHPNVCRVYDLGMVEGLHFLSMEYIDGEDLASLLRRIGRLPQDKAIEFTRKICAGLSAAHERGVLHRDLKPANIMIDGRGQPRITDFGLAGLAAEIPLSDLRSGTPAYMSPEQKAGKEVTTRSDIYSLGLVLAEMFTGAKPEDNRLKSVPQDLDPAIERLILRCLEEQPKRRPNSALSAAMALPGANPIAAALAAGETPSPEMVAASTEKEGFSTRTAVLCMVAIVAAMIGGVVIHSTVTLLARAPVTIRPDALADRVQALLKSIGYTAEPGSTAYGYWCCDNAVTRYLSGFGEAQKTAALASQRPAVISFFYRQDDWGGFQGRPYDVFRMSEAAPPGYVSVRLDAQGRLLRLEAHPRPGIVNAGPVDWAVLFAAAGLDISRFTPSEPRTIPEVATDSRAAWDGDFGNGSPVPVRVEAAAWRNRPVEFRVVPSVPQPPGGRLPRPLILVVLARVTLFVGLAGGTLVIAWRNLRQGRSDKRGALVIAAAAFISLAIRFLFGPRHVPDPDGLAFSLGLVCLSWLVYIAAEPYVRRYWPDSLISWSRLCSGKVRNPLVASHILAALVVAEIWALVVSPISDMATGYGNAPGVAMLAARGLVHLGGAGRLIAHWPSEAMGGLFEAVVLLIAIVLLRLAIRKLWLADLLAAAALAFWIGGLRPQAVVLLPAWLGFMWLLRRFGLLSFLAVYMMQRALVFTPLAVTGWVGASFLPIHLLPIVLALWALWVIVTSQRRLVTESAA
jgi:hypothetical protein